MLSRVYRVARTAARPNGPRPNKKRPIPVEKPLVTRAAPMHILQGNRDQVNGFRQ